jgi:coenzyme F420-reducing hydrogenase delta subunit
MTYQLHFEGRVVGKLHIEDEQIQFEWESESAAESFFEIFKPMVEQYVASKIREVRYD